MHQLESIFWGILAGLSAIFIELMLFATFSLFANPGGEISMTKFFTLPFFVIAIAFVEEFCKYTVIATRIEKFSLKWSYFLNSLLVGLGFLAVELGLILEVGNIPSAALFSELAIIHLGTAAIIGYVITFNNPKKISTFFLAVFPALVFHASYNILSLGQNMLTDYARNALLLVLVFLIFFLALNTRRKLAQE